MTTEGSKEVLTLRSFLCILIRSQTTKNPLGFIMEDAQMLDQKIPAIVLAAGRGTRMMHTELPKVLVEFRERPMVEYILQAIEKSGVCSKPVVVVGYRQELIREVLAGRVDYAVQMEQRGTADAVASARAIVEGQSEHVLVFYGDNPFVRAETIAAFANAHIQSGAIITLAVTTTQDYNGPRASLEYYGRIVRDKKGDIVRITEYKDADDQLRQSSEVNTMMYAFNAPWLWSHIGKIQNSNAQQEYLITDLVGLAAAEGVAIAAFSIPTKECYGINSKEELELLNNRDMPA